MGVTALTPNSSRISAARQTKPFRTLSGIDPYTGAFGTGEVVHLLKRTMFGAAVADVNYFKTRTVTQAVDELIDNNFPLSSQPVNDYNSADFTDPVVAPGQTWINAPNLSDGDFWRSYSFRKWHVGQMINQGRSIQMKMMLFWHNHFATHIDDVFGSKMFYNHQIYFRSNYAGNFKAMAKFISTDPIMLQYLGGQYNTKWAPNENYARELQELFCIGKGAGSHYTENDVKEAARVLTGWKVDYDNNTYYFDINDHDTDNKVFSSFYNSTTILGRNSNTAGNTELDDLLNMIFSTSECALFICRKLYRFFVYYDIDAATEANVIEPLATILRANNYEIKPVLKTLFKSQHFFDAVNYGAQIKSPIDFMTGLMREFKVAFPAASDYVSNYNFWATIQYFTYIMNQDYGNPPNVAGWPAYYQAPQYYEMWINSTTYPKRVDFSKWMVEYGIDGNNNNNIKVDVIEFTKLLSAPSNPNTLVNDALDILYRVPIAAISKSQLKTNTLLEGQANDNYWTSAWNSFIADPNNAVKRSVVEIRLKNLYRFIVNSPEYQLA